MRTRFCLPVFALLFATFSLTAQREETVLGERGWGLSGLWGGYTHHYTSYNNADGFNRGGFFGFEFGKSLFIGWSHYSLRDNITLPGGDNRQFDFRMNGGIIGYAFVPYKAFHPTLNVEIGRGKSFLSYEGHDNTLVVQPALGLEINVFRWFRFGLEGGYRFVRNVDYVSLSDKDLSGAFGKATLKFGFSWGRHHKKPDYKKNYEQ